MMSSSEIPRHFASFAEGLRASLRRRPAAVVVGEARDLETVEAVVRAADYGIAVYTTAHTIGVAATIRRMVAEFPPAERAERGAALVDQINLVVTQCLLPKPARRPHRPARMARLHAGLQGGTPRAAPGELAGPDHGGGHRAWRGSRRGRRARVCPKPHPPPRLAAPRRPLLALREEKNDP